jgi:hypothetical protein
MLAVLFKGLLANVSIPLPFEAIVKRLGVVNQTLISSFVAIGNEDWGRGGTDPHNSTSPVARPYKTRIPSI